KQPLDLPLYAIGTVHPQISPSGKAVVVSYQGSIWRLPAEGGTIKRLAAGAGFALQPCWSPDERRVAFLQGKGWSGGQVKVVDSRTGAAIPVPGTLFATGRPAFTPDGRHLVGNLRRERQLEAFRSLDLETGELKTLLRLPSPRQPWALSSDGKWVAYVTTMDMPEQQTGNDGPQADLWKVPSSGGEAERIVRFPARLHALCWSLAGDALYVSTELGGVHNDLYRVALDDPERPTRVTFGQADEDWPSVSRDGRRLLYADNHKGCPALVLRDLAADTSRTLPIERLDFGVPVGRLSLKLVDKGTGRPLVARVALEHADGSFHAPPGALWRIFGDVGHFYVRGEVEMNLPAGRYRLRAWHGPEYRMQQLNLELRSAETTQQTVVLERWTDPNARGWYSGENHIHANYGYGEYYNSPATMADMCAGEGLNVGNFMVANSDGDGVFDREYFRGRPDALSTEQTILYWNEEYRSTIWGHMTLVNLKQVVEPVFTGFKDTTNPYDIPTMSDIAWKTHRQGGLVNYTHPASQPADLYRGAYSAKGLPIYAALGKIDTMDVMGSGDRASSALYHRLLNCGFRIAASAGTDCFLNRMRSWLPGGERAYVKMDGPFSYQKWIEGLRAGKSFVTNGPMLELSVDGKGIGGEVKLPSAGEVHVRATVASQFPLDRLEVLYNGKVMATAVPVKKELTTELDTTIPIKSSGWIAARAVGPAAADVQGEWLHGHTSPVYVVVGDKPPGSADDARYFLAWIDRLWDTIQERDRFPDRRSQAEVEAEVNEARKVYGKIIDKAARTTR
ncbi:MAG: hypothetical protein E6K70_17905, partial [Planctomycetota bacterium]